MTQSTSSRNLPWCSRVLVASLLLVLPVGIVRAAPPASPEPAKLPSVQATSGDSSDHQELAEEDRASMQGAADAEGVMDLELVRKGGLEPFDPEAPVQLKYLPTSKESAEYLLEIQASMRVPGRQAAVPHRRLYTIKVDVVEGDGPETLDWEFRIVDARESQLQGGEDGTYKEVLVRNEEEIGAIVPLVTSILGAKTRAGGILTEDKALDWVRLELPVRPRKLGFGWRTLVPEEVGSRRELSDGIYLLHRMLRLPGGGEVAAIRGRFRSRGQEQATASFQTLGQDRVLFDVTRGRVLYREFRMEGSYLRKTKEGQATYQARIKGLLMEKSLLQGLDGQKRVDRLNAANAVFGG